MHDGQTLSQYSFSSLDRILDSITHYEYKNIIYQYEFSFDELMDDFWLLEYLFWTFSKQNFVEFLFSLELFS